jgi:hypothetical protein
MSAVGYFARNPAVIFQGEPSRPHGECEFRFGDGLADFRFQVTEEEHIAHINVFGGSDTFSGFGLTTKERGRYRVYVVPPFKVPLGRYAKTLAQIFVRDYGAIDTSEFMNMR